MHVFIADLFSTLDHKNDSTLYLIDYAQKNLKHRSENQYCWARPLAYSVSTINKYNGIYIDGYIKNGQLVEQVDFVPLSSVSAVHWRADPPVDLSQLRTWIAYSGQVPRNRVQYLNSFEALLTLNEKLLPVVLHREFGAEYIPTIVTQDLRILAQFFEQFGRTGVVVKPFASAASRDIFFATNDTLDTPAFLERCNVILERNGAYLIAQPYDDNILQQGEVRVFVVGGRVVGALHKQAPNQNPILNFDAHIEREKPKLSLVPVSQEMRLRVEPFARYLMNAGVYLATVDFVGSKLLEVNITSPGLIKSHDTLAGQSVIAQAYWEFDEPSGIGDGKLRGPTSL